MPFSLLWHLVSAKHLVPPFILSEADLEVDTMPKQHNMSSSIEDHSMYFKEVDMRTHLQKHGVFS